MDEERLLKFTESTGKELSKEFDTEVVITGIDLPARENHQKIGNLICQDGNTTWVTAAKEGGGFECRYGERNRHGGFCAQGREVSGEGDS